MKDTILRRVLWVLGLLELVNVSNEMGIVPSDSGPGLRPYRFGLCGAANPCIGASFGFRLYGGTVAVGGPGDGR